MPSAYGTADATGALPQQSDWIQMELALEPGFLDFLCEREQLGALTAASALAHVLRAAAGPLGAALCWDTDG